MNVELEPWELEASRATIQDFIRQAGPGMYVEALAGLHATQARIIRAERYRADQAEAQVRAATVWNTSPLSGNPKWAELAAILGQSGKPSR